MNNCETFFEKDALNVAKEKRISPTSYAPTSQAATSIMGSSLAYSPRAPSASPANSGSVAKPGAQWEHLAAVTVHAGKVPNRRHKPSILDQFRGWTVLPSSRICRSTKPRRLIE